MALAQLSSKNQTAALTEVKRLFARGEDDAARSFCAQLQRKSPEDPEIRAAMQRIVQASQGFDRDGYVEELVEQLAADEPMLIEFAAMGWQYACFFDERYVDQALERVPPPVIDKDITSQPPIDVGPVSDVFGRLRWFDDHSERYAYLEALAVADAPLLRDDDFISVPDAELMAALRASFDKDCLNIVVVGAGCVGLALANALQTGFGKHARIMLVENRVERRHRKRPYSRVWLTHIDMTLLASVVSLEVAEALGHSGVDGFMGASLDLYETLLLLSCRERGVTVYFDENPDYGFLENSDVDLLFDATGGRFILPKGAEPAAAPA
ncbi:MAG: hypothetical protein AAF556_11890, partial [Pseudomonadota bacterium]